MKKLIILRGNSGSGKTTVAKELQKRFGKNTMLIAQDAIRREMLWVNDGENTPALPLMKELLRYGNQHCEVVILEGIMNVEWYQSLFDLALQLYGTRVYAYYFDIPFEETLRRHQTRAKCNEFGEEEMRKWWREKDFAKELKEKSITTEQDMESIVEDIFDMVSNG
ncbi:MAG: kinase [Lachnospiraceae bacterium]|nr:kinase [Lachnospiraceae bacterium]